MCGRFVSASSADEIAKYFDASPPDVELDRSFNVAPTNDIYGIVDAPGGRRLAVFHWGLVPAWAKEMKLGQKMINARAETLLSKGAFKAALTRRRCLIPADGFYEWQKIPGQKTKQPMFIRRLDGEPLAFAGLWETWRDPAGPPDAPLLHSATIITTAANQTMQPVHDRMPVILPAAAWEQWLSTDNRDLESLTGLLVPAPNDLLTLRPVSTQVNNVRNNGEELVAPVEPETNTLLD
jgi:putative SOS response-associated peptidase YedK